MIFENITDQIKEIASLLLSFMLLAKWHQGESTSQHPKVSQIAKEEDNYLRVGEWG